MRATKDFKVSKNAKSVMSVLAEYSRVGLKPQRSCHGFESLLIFDRFVNARNIAAHEFRISDG